MRITDVAERMGVSPSTAKRELSRPGAPARFRVSQRCVRWDADHIDRWLASRAELPTADITPVDVPAHLATPNRRGPRRAA